MHVANICLKCFQLLETYVSSVFIWVLHIFCNGYTRVFLVFQMYVASVSAILDVCCKCFYLNVAKVDRVLHILQWDPPATVAGRRACAWKAEGWSATHQRAWEVEGDGSKDASSLHLSVQQGAGTGRRRSPVCVQQTCSNRFLLTGEIRYRFRLTSGFRQRNKLNGSCVRPGR
jgi:hypothetical protein